MKLQGRTTLSIVFFLILIMLNNPIKGQPAKIDLESVYHNIYSGLLKKDMAILEQNFSSHTFSFIDKKTLDANPSIPSLEDFLYHTIV